MPSLIGDPAQLTAERLTGILRATGLLLHGRVATVQVGARIEGGYSLLWPLRVRYTSIAKRREAAPGALLLKVPRPDIDAAQTAANGRRECFFYTRLAPLVPELGLVRCLSAAFDAAIGRWHLVLEDLSATHVEAAAYLPPPEPHGTDAVELLARLHARWWQDPRLDRLRQEIGQVPDAAQSERLAGNVRQAITAFLTFVDGYVTGERQQLCDRLAAAFPTLLRRQLAGPLTLLHGDAHWRNFLYPRDRTADTIRLFDWQSCAVGAPAHDVAYLLARHWYPEPRTELLARLLHRYHDTLLRCGVPGYHWDDCWHDFSLAALRHAVAPATNWYRWARNIQGHEVGEPQPSPAAWASRLERNWTLLDALGCTDVLTSTAFERSSAR